MPQPAPEPETHAPRLTPKRGGRLWLLAGIGVVLLLGAAVSYAALSDPDERLEDSGVGMRVEVKAPAPPPPVAPLSSPLEVLSPDMVQQAAPMAPAPLTPEIAALLEPPAPEAGVQASFNCADARPGAEQMVCADASLAAADREMAQAYRRALRAGVPAEDLRMEQWDWIALREDAARRSPQALAAIYFQRIDDLNAIADDRWAAPTLPFGEAVAK